MLATCNALTGLLYRVFPASAVLISARNSTIS